MSPPGAREIEVPVLLGNGVGAESLQRIPRKWTRDAVRLLTGDGYTVTANQALRLLRDWREWRRDDVREFIADEFLSYARRRGDLLVVRSKPQQPWRVSS